MKGELERQLQEREAEVTALQKRLTSITNIIKQLGVESSDSAAHDMLGPLRTVVRDRWGNPIANIDVDPDSIRITPTGSMPIDTQKAPFRSFFLSRVLIPMRDEDEHAKAQGRLSQQHGIVFECHEDSGMLVELVVHHYGTPQRLERIKDALNWTLEKQQAKRPHTT